MQATSCFGIVLSGPRICSAAAAAAFNPIAFVVDLGVLFVGLYGWALSCTRASK